MSTFKLSLKGDGISIDKDIDQATALTILNAVLSQNGSVSQPVSIPTAIPSGMPSMPTENSPTLSPDSYLPPTHNKSKPTSLREYVNEKLPKTNAEIILTIAQFIFEHESKTAFSTMDIRAKYSAAGQPLSKNFNRDFQKAIDKSWIAEFHKNRGMFFVTRTGEGMMESGFARSKK